MTPGGIFTILFGVLLIEYHGMPYWLKMKLILVFLLVIYHVWCGVLLEKFKTDSNPHGHVWYRSFQRGASYILSFDCNISCLQARLKPH